MVAPLLQLQLRHLLHVFQSDPAHRGRCQGTGPACEQAKDQIIRRCPGGQFNKARVAAAPAASGTGWAASTWAICCKGRP